MLEIEIEELWQLMMKQSRMRRLIVAGSVTNQNLKLIDKEWKMKQKIDDIQQQQRCRAFRQLQTKVWDPGGFLSRYEDTKSGDHEYFLPWESDAGAFSLEKSLYFSRHRGSCILRKLVS